MYMSKHRTQLYLDAAQRRVLDEEAERTGKSMGQLIREAVDVVYLKRAEQQRPLAPDDPIWGLVGSGESGTADTATRHDEHLYGSSSWGSE